MNENVIVKEYEFDIPLIQEIDSLIDNSLRDCHNKNFHTSDAFCEYDFQLIIIGENQMINLTISGKSMALYELNKKLTVARGNGFKLNQINEVTIKIYSNLSHININFHLKFRFPFMHTRFFRKFSQNPD